MKPTRTEIVRRLGVLLAERLKLSASGQPLGDDVGLLGHGIGLDSVEVLQLVGAIEETFDLTVDDDDLKPEYFRTVGTLVTFIHGRAE